MESSVIKKDGCIIHYGEEKAHGKRRHVILDKQKTQLVDKEYIVIDES